MANSRFRRTANLGCSEQANKQLVSSEEFFSETLELLD
jgi:hypothetical protein